MRNSETRCELMLCGIGGIAIEKITATSCHHEARTQLGGNICFIGFIGCNVICFKCNNNNKYIYE